MVTVIVLAVVVIVAIIMAMVVVVVVSSEGKVLGHRDFWPYKIGGAIRRIRSHHSHKIGKLNH